jgi:cell division protein ZapA
VSEAPYRVVRVDIHGQQYPIRSRLDAQYVVELATYVNRKMQAAADTAQTADSLRLAVLAAVNIADELFRCRQTQVSSEGEFTERAQELERLVDQALALLTSAESPSNSEIQLGLDRAAGA